MANLAQISNLRGSARGAALLAIMLKYSPLLRALDRNSAWEEAGTKYQYRTFNGGSVLEYRAAGNGYASALKSPGNPENGEQKFGGFQIDVDQSILADERRGLIQLGPWLDEQIIEEAYSFARDLEKELFRASGAGNAYKGISTILDGVADIPGYAGVTGVINAKDAVGGVVDHLDLSASANYDPFIEHLLLWIQEVENATELWMSPRLYARMQTIARKTNMLGQTTDQFGKTVETFNTCIMYPMLDTSIVHTEADDAAAATTTSLYIVAPGEKNFSLASNSGLEIEDYEITEDKQVGRFKAEVRCSWKIQRKRSIRRVRNIKV